MKLISIAISSLLFFTGCNFYSSAGRKQFEARAPGQVGSNIGESNVPASDEQDKAAHCFVLDLEVLNSSADPFESYDIIALTPKESLLCKKNQEPII